MSLEREIETVIRLSLLISHDHVDCIALLSARTWVDLHNKPLLWTVVFDFEKYYYTIQPQLCYRVVLAAVRRIVSVYTVYLIVIQDRTTPGHGREQGRNSFLLLFCFDVCLPWFYQLLGNIVSKKKKWIFYFQFHFINNIFLKRLISIFLR